MKLNRRKLFLSALVALLFLLPAGTVLAQTYSFTVQREVVDVYWESDGSQTLEYLIVFENSRSADPIDYVDIGFPTNSYRLNNVSASIDGHPISNIEDSPYVTYGVALGLGSNAIRPGDTGTVTLRATNIEDVLYVDEEDSTYASAVFSPNYFGSEFVNGSTDLTIVYHLPPGVQPEEPKWHGAPSDFPDTPETGFDADGRITYTWNNPSASASKFYLFGASFPQSYVPAGSIGQAADYTSYSDSGFDLESIMPFFVFSCFCLIFILFIVIAAVSESRRKLKYLPPKISIEGNGIKRGLTAPEAAILLEEPMDKILTMILFSVIKKGAAVVTQKDPMLLDITTPQPEGLHEYEVLFLEAFAETHKTKRRKLLQNMMVKLVKSVANKMKGFSKRETTAFYKRIIEEAWQQVESAETPEVKSEKYQEELEWTMMDKNYKERTQRTFTGPVVIPRWWGGYDPSIGRSTTVSTPTRSSSVPNVSTGRGSTPSLPTLPGSEFAASLVGGIQNMSSGVLGGLGSFTSGVTKVTNPPPVTSTNRSSGGWSGGGSSCACACAGCACACAGGGR